VREPEGQVFFGRAGQVHDAGLAGAVLDYAVVGLIVEQKAAVSHGKVL
jgi:hypothetical protein